MKAINLDFCSVKLKKAVIEHDASAPAKESLFAEGEEKMKAYHSDVLDINIEEWYNEIEKYTFPTKFMPVSVDDANLFVNHYEEFQSFVEKLPASKEKDHEAEFLPSEAVTAGLNEIQVRLQTTMTSFDTPDCQFFVKTSSRSPKDAPSSQKTLKDTFVKLLRASGSDTSENNLLIQLLKASKYTLRADNALDAFKLLLRSRRIWQDYTLALKYLDRWMQNLVVRQWIPVNVDMEFRCFVYEGKLTAISQYHHLCYFEKLAKGVNKEWIVNQISELFAGAIHPALKHKFTSYILDIAVIDEEYSKDDELIGGKLLVIELNPFLVTTDSCCFEWKHDLDILKGVHVASKADVAIRVRDGPLAGATSMLYDEMKELVQTVKREVRA